MMFCTVTSKVKNYFEKLRFYFKKCEGIMSINITQVRNKIS